MLSTIKFERGKEKVQRIEMEEAACTVFDDAEAKELLDSIFALILRLDRVLLPSASRF